MAILNYELTDIEFIDASHTAPGYIAESLCLHSPLVLLRSESHHRNEQGRFSHSASRILGEQIDIDIDTIPGSIFLPLVGISVWKLGYRGEPIGFFFQDWMKPIVTSWFFFLHSSRYPIPNTQHPIPRSLGISVDFDWEYWDTYPILYSTASSEREYKGISVGETKYPSTCRELVRNKHMNVPLLLFISEIMR